MLGGLFGSDLEGSINGEIETEALQIEPAEDLYSSAKTRVSSGEMKLERFKVHAVCQHF